MVTQFVGFMGAYNHPHGLDPVMAGIIGGLISTWATFAPCFLWILVGAPFVEYLRGNQSLTAILNAITAAVVGVVLNLAVFFTQHALFPKAEPDWFGIGLALAAFIALLHFHWRMPLVIGLAGAAVSLEGSLVRRYREGCRYLQTATTNGTSDMAPSHGVARICLDTDERDHFW